MSGENWGKLGQTSPELTPPGRGTLICLSYEGGRLSSGHWVTPAVCHDTRVGGGGHQDPRTPELLSVDQ